MGSIVKIDVNDGQFVVKGRPHIHMMVGCNLECSTPVARDVLVVSTPTKDEEYK